MSPQAVTLCAWCRPLNELPGTHGICPRHQREVLEEIKAMRGATA